MRDGTGVVAADQDFWSGRRVLVTGHTGFKGAWLCTYLGELGADVLGVSLPRPTTRPSLWDELALDTVTDVRADVADPPTWTPVVRDFSPEVVLHLAAQSLVSDGFTDPVTTFRTNVMGTVAVMDLLDQLSGVLSAVIITTDKVYDTRQAAPYVERHYLGGADPYAASKTAAELVAASWPTAEPTRIGVARAGNVIGGGDWAANRIVPDLVRSWLSGQELVLRRPRAVRPWQHVIEPLVGYLSYAQVLAEGRDLPQALNFGPRAADAVTVEQLVTHAESSWARIAGRPPAGWRSATSSSWGETGTLTLDSTASTQHLGLLNRWDWRTAVDLTLDWYFRAAAGESPRTLVNEQFDAYFKSGSREG